MLLLSALGMALPVYSTIQMYLFTIIIIYISCPNQHEQLHQCQSEKLKDTDQSFYKQIQIDVIWKSRNPAPAKWSKK